MSLVNINKNFSLDTNFWHNNPQLTIMNPFSELYRSDNSEDKDISSKQMFCIIFMSDPDPEINKFFRIPYDERLTMLRNDFLESFNPDDDITSRCLEQYPTLFMGAVERALKEEIETMQDRVKLFKNTPYSLDVTDTDDRGKPFLRKGTATQLDNMRAKTPKIFENYEKLEAKFLKSKMESRLYGGRKKSKSEQKLG